LNGDAWGREQARHAAEISLGTRPKRPGCGYGGDFPRVATSRAAAREAVPKSIEAVLKSIEAVPKSIEAVPKGIRVMEIGTPIVEIVAP